MDISDLLSPSEDSKNPKDTPRSSSAALAVHGQAPTSALSREVLRSPDRAMADPRPQSIPNDSVSLPRTVPAQDRPGAGPAFAPAQQDPRSRLDSGDGRTSTPSISISSYDPRSAIPRSPALLDTLVVSTPLQSEQLARNRPSPLPRTSSLEAAHSPTAANRPGVSSPRVLRSISAQSMAELTMAEAPASTPPPRQFATPALSDAESKRATELLTYLADHSYEYNSHVELINLLHKGLVAHIFPAKDSDEHVRDPHAYPLLTELRQAREAMDSRFAVGESVWADWLNDEMLIAKSGEDRIAVTELCIKAVQDEPSSVKLWTLYIDWLLTNYSVCNDIQGSDQSGWSDSDKSLCSQLFTREMLLDVLRQAAAGAGTGTRWRIDESHLLWDRFIDFVSREPFSSSGANDADTIRTMFAERLQIPHATSQDTAQLLRKIMSKYGESDWEATMSQATKLAEPARREMNRRKEQEFRLTRAFATGDKVTLFSEFMSYLKAEHKRSRTPGSFQHELVCGVYERALLEFPTYTDWWLDYVDFVIKENPSYSVLPLIERATRHCPWSGDLWAKRILRSDVERISRDEIEATKHRATNSGLVPIGGMEELIKVLTEWCSFLRRHAFRQGSSEDDLDTAEFGIIQAIEDVTETGRKLHGDDFNGDPSYRLEQIAIKFYSEGRRFGDARDTWQKLPSLAGKSFEFWSRYYNWELWLWGYERMSERHRVETTGNGPHLATAVCDQMIKVKDVDDPEQLLSLYNYHFTQHESAEKLQGARIAAKEYARHIAARRASETLQATYANMDELSREAIGGDKRKRDEEADSEGEVLKKSKPEQAQALLSGPGEPSPQESDRTGRDREHSTVVLSNLPAGAGKKAIQDLFHGCGEIVSIDVSAEPSGQTATAMVEFATPEDADFAQTRDGRELEGRTIQVHSGSESTIFCTNYPEAFDEADIRKLFQGYGDIVSVRLPTLNYNSRRRFCYVQFLSARQARAAEEAMDGKMMDARHRLVAKISRPENKKERAGPLAGKRELYVSNIDNRAPESEVRAFFEQYGQVTRVNLLKRVNGSRLGTGFVVYATAEEAAAALAADSKPLRDRILHVELATPKGGATKSFDRMKKTLITVKQSESPEATVANGRRDSDASMDSTRGEKMEKKNANERKIAIFNLPDTVNDARIKAAMEQYGPIKKIQLRRADQAAIVEFANVQDVFKVHGGVDCPSLGAEVKTGTLGDLFSRAKKRHNPETGFIRPALVSRPAQPSARRTGLGYKRGGIAQDAASAARPEPEGPPGGSKSNADFRAMFVKSTADDDDVKE